MADYYATLEIQRSSTESDIKKAYRKLALKWHPDKNPDNKDAAESKFKEISEAYEVLSDPEKRKVYDRYGKEGLTGGGGGGGAGMPHFNFEFHSPEDIFRNFFGDSDPFSNMFAFGGQSRSNAHDPFGMGFGGLGGGSFTSFNNFGDFGGGSSSFTSFSSGGGGFGGGMGGGGSYKSVTKSVKVVNGEKVETKKVVENGKETVEIRKNGRLTSLMVDGKPDDERFAIELSKESNGGHHDNSGHSSHKSHRAPAPMNNYHPYNDYGLNNQHYDEDEAMRRATRASLEDQAKRRRREHGSSKKNNSKY